MINDIVYNKPTIMWTLKGMQIDFSHNNLKLAYTLFSKSKRRTSDSHLYSLNFIFTHIIGGHKLWLPIIPFLFCQTKHIIIRKALHVTLYCLIKNFCLNLVELGEVTIKHHLHATNRIYSPLNFILRRQEYWLPVSIQPLWQYNSIPSVYWGYRVF